MWVDRNAIADDGNPLAAIQLLFKQDRGIRANIGYRQQIQPGLRGHLLHNLLKALGVVAEHQRVDGFTAL